MHAALVGINRFFRRALESGVGASGSANKIQSDRMRTTAARTLNAADTHQPRRESFVGRASCWRQRSVGTGWQGSVIMVHTKRRARSPTEMRYLIAIDRS